MRLSGYLFGGNSFRKRIITTIDVSDDKINMGKDYAEIVSKNEDIMVKEVKTILEKPRKIKKSTLL